MIEPVAKGVELGFDGFSECWFQDRAAFDVTMHSAEWDEMNANAKNNLDRDLIVRGWSALVDDLTITGG